MRQFEVDIVFNNELIENIRLFVREYIKNVICKSVKVEIAINEALNNAFIHGNSTNDVRLKMYVLNEKKLIIRIKDRGNGFLTEKTTDPNTGDFLEMEGGRGIFLMKAFCDEVVYNNLGNDVLLVKQLTGGDR